jgi:N-acetylneuraminic acid mutarotase
MATSTNNAPSDRTEHTAVWSGGEMIVWGGFGPSGVTKTGGRYNPDTNSWTGTSRTHAPLARSGHTAVWTGSEMIVWGGVNNGGNAFGDGGRYCAAGTDADPSTP